MKIKTFLICDDIRKEVGGKYSLIGIYGESIDFNVTPDAKDSWPKSMKIGMYTKIDIESEDPRTFVLKMKYNDKEEQVIGHGDRGGSSELKKSKCVIALVLNNFIFSEPGFIKFTFDFFDADGKLVASLNPAFDLEIKEQVREQLAI